MRILAVVSYLGTNYKGFQIQPNEITIEEVIENTLSKYLNDKVKIYAAGRTDAGVHAFGQTFHFDAKKDVDLNKMRYSINMMLPRDIHIVSLKEVNDAFDARILALRKHYQYKINVGEVNPFLLDQVYDLNRKLNLKKMREALKLFVGCMCYKNFTSKEEDIGGFVRSIYSASIHKNKNIVTIDFIGSGFMRYMVRMLVGTLVQIGLEKEQVSYASKMLNEKKRSVVSYKAPSSGLYLMEVFY